MTASPVFVDANIAIYAAGAPSPLKEPCRRIVEAVGNTSGMFVTSAEVLQEVLHVSRRGQHPQRRATIFSEFAAAMGSAVLPVERADVVLAAELSDQYGPGPSTRDLIHAAVMRRHGLSRVVTADRHFDGFADMERLDPLLLDEWADPAWFPLD